MMPAMTRAHPMRARRPGRKATKPVVRFMLPPSRPPRSVIPGRRWRWTGLWLSFPESERMSPMIDAPVETMSEPAPVPAAPVTAGPEVRYVSNADESCRMFASDFRERFSHIKPWVPHAIFVPVLAVSLAAAFRTDAFWRVAAFYVVGLFLGRSSSTPSTAAASIRPHSSRTIPAGSSVPSAGTSRSCRICRRRATSSISSRTGCITIIRTTRRASCWRRRSAFPWPRSSTPPSGCSSAGRRLPSLPGSSQATFSTTRCTISAIIRAAGRGSSGHSSAVTSATTTRTRPGTSGSARRSGTTSSERADPPRPRAAGKTPPASSSSRWSPLRSQRSRVRIAPGAPPAMT